MLSVFGNTFDADDLTAMKQVMNTHLVGMGKITTKFEEVFAQKIGFKYAVATSSCTNAFWLLFQSLNFPNNTDVIIPNNHFFGIKNVLKLHNLNIIAADVDINIPNITLAAIEKVITPNTKAIIFLEHSGHPLMEIGKIRDYLKNINRSDILCILDAANSPFTTYKTSYTALQYDIALYSFDLNKILVTGDGGMVLSNNEDLIKEIKSRSYYGIQDSSKSGFDKSQNTANAWWEVDISTPSIKLSMNNLTAALGLSQIQKVPRFLHRRSEIRQLYLKGLQPLVNIGKISLPTLDLDVFGDLYLFWIKLQDENTRNSLARYLLSKEIYTTVKYQPIDPQAITPNAFDYYARSLCLPFNQNLSNSDVQYVINQIEMGLNVRNP